MEVIGHQHTGIKVLRKEKLGGSRCLHSSSVEPEREIAPDLVNF
jgi:hypothetical protein